MSLLLFSLSHLIGLTFGSLFNLCLMSGMASVVLKVQLIAGFLICVWVPFSYLFVDFSFLGCVVVVSLAHIYQNFALHRALQRFYCGTMFGVSG